MNEMNSEQVFSIIKNRYFLAASSAILLYCAFYLADAFILIALAPALLMALLEDPKKAIIPSLIVGLSSAAYLRWTLPTPRVYMFGIMIYTMIIFLTLIATCFISKKTGKAITIFSASLVFPFLIFLHELIFGYAWFNMAVFLNMPAIPYYIGVFGIYFLILLSNILLATALAERKAISFIPLAVLLILIIIQTYSPLIEASETTGGKQPRVALIQMAPDSSLIGKGDMQGMFDKFRKASLEASEKKPGIIVWPEYSLMLGVEEQERFFDRFKELAKETDAFIIAGMRLEIDNNTREAHDSAAVFYPDGSRMGIYDSMNVFPIKPYNNKLVNGDKPLVIDSEFGRFGVMICFDEPTRAIWRAYSDAGVDFAISVSSNMQTTSRGKELLAKVAGLSVNKYQIPIYRVTTNGVTAAYDNNGRIVQRTHSKDAEILITG